MAGDSRNYYYYNLVAQRPTAVVHELAQCQLAVAGKFCLLNLQKSDVPKRSSAAPYNSLTDDQFAALCRAASRKLDVITAK